MMFNCLSRKEKPSNITLRKASLISKQNLRLSSCSSNLNQRNKRQGLIQQQINIFKKKQKPSILKKSSKKLINIIEESPIKLQPIKIENLQEKHIFSKNTYRGHRYCKSNFVQSNIQPEIKMSTRQIHKQDIKEDKFEQKIENVVEGLSITSFGQVFQQVQIDLKGQIMQAIQNLTIAPSFLPKKAQASLEGMNKTMMQDETPSINLSDSLCSSILDLNLNERLSYCFINNDYEQGQKIFNKMTINQKNGPDLKGFTPIYLLTLISLTDSTAFSLLKKLLRDPELDPNKKVYFGSKPIQEAILFKNIPLLTVLFRSSYLYKINQIKKSLKELASTLITFPDMYLQLYVKVGSFVPLVDKITPDDTIKIFKRGNKLRIDYSLVGYSFLKCKRRQMSCVLQKIGNQDFTIVALNHDKKLMADLLQPFEDQQLVLFIQDLLSAQIKRINPKIDNVQIQKQYNIFNKIIRDYIIDRVAIKHQLKIKYTSATQKLKPRSKDSGKELEFLKSWKDYLQYVPNMKVVSKQKQIKLGVWISNSFPLKFSQLLKLINFLSFFHESGKIIYNFLTDEKIEKNMSGFPVKIQIPMNFSLYLDVKIANFSLKVPQIQYQFQGKYIKEKRSLFQKTLLRREKRLSILKLYT